MEQRVLLQTGDFWSDFFLAFGILVPNVATVILALIGYWKSVDNNRALVELKRKMLDLGIDADVRHEEAMKPTR